ncbi:MAG: TIM barrel protein [Planctomycetota bacterium]|nr:TIM barrel protein [Planctomycetota bacterium]
MSHSIALKNCSTAWVVSGFADEAGPSTAEQIAATKRAGFTHVDLRGLDGHNISALPLDRAHEVRKLLDAAGVNVGMFGSPIGKIDIADDFKIDLDKLAHMGKLSEILGCKSIRIFSYYNNKAKATPEAFERESIDRLRRLRDAAAGPGLILYHENERHIFGDGVKANLAIAKALRDPEGKKGAPFRLIFDFDNYNQSGEDVWQAWLQMRDLTDAFHLKESDKNNLHVPMGTGAGYSKQILADALARGWKGQLSLEPHLQHSAAVLATVQVMGLTGPSNKKFSELPAADCYQVAAEHATALLKSIGAPLA